MKDSLFLEVCRNEYRAVLQMIGEAVALCPEELWSERTDEPAFWQQAYHALMYTDFYLGDDPRAYRKPTFAEEKANDLGFIPTVTPTKAELVAFAGGVSKKTEAVLSRLTSAELEGPNAYRWTGATVAHRLIYNVRHTQHHIGRLASLLARRADKHATWIITATKGS